MKCSRTAVCSALVGLLVVAAVGTGFTATINVPASKPTIQTAIDAAQNGDEVLVAKGTYRETIDFGGKAITVRSTAPTDPAIVSATIMDGEQNGSVVTFRSGETVRSVLSGLTITHGSGTPVGPDRHGGGIYCFGASPTITNCTVNGNTAGGENGGGGGIYCVAGSSPTIADNTISGNTANYGGGGIACYRSQPTVSGNTIDGNSARYVGGGICCGDDSTAVIVNNHIRGNTAAWGGGGIFCYASSPAITNNRIVGNGKSQTCGSGGGIGCRNSSPQITNNIICGNAADNGGGVHCFNSSPSILSTTVASNEGGGIYCYYSSSPKIANSIVALSVRGGGLSADKSSTPAVAYCDLFGNTGGDYVSLSDQTGQNGNISQDPLFADVAKGDFHLRSKGGRWDPLTKTWVLDTVHSPCIDAGDPAAPFDKEPAPNGGRGNMGAEGNTAEASKAVPSATQVPPEPFSGGGYYLREVPNATVTHGGQGWVVTPASSVRVGGRYTVMSRRGGGRGGKVALIVITAVRGRSAEGRVVAWID